MDPDFRHVDVDKGLHMPLPHAYTSYQSAPPNTSVGCCFPAILKYHTHDGVDYAMSAVARGVG